MFSTEYKLKRVNEHAASKTDTHCPMLMVTSSASICFYKSVCGSAYI